MNLVGLIDDSALRRLAPSMAEVGIADERDRELAWHEVGEPIVWDRLQAPGPLSHPGHDLAGPGPYLPSLTGNRYRSMSDAGDAREPRLWGTRFNHSYESP